MIKNFESFSSFESELNQIIDSVPDSDVPSEISFFDKIDDKIVYVEGWCDRCFSNYNVDTRDEKVKLAKDLTKKRLEEQPYLPQNKNLRGYNLVGYEFVELPDNEVNYCLSIGIYEKDN